MLTIKNLNFGYLRQVDILKNISIDIDEGDIFFLIGSNGSGKSTLLKNTLGLVNPDSGSISINGTIMNTSSRLNLLKKIGVLLENASFYGHLTLKENITLVAAYYNVSKKRIDKTIEILGLKQESDTLAGILSTGFKQRLGLAMAIVHEPKIVFLDEPTNGLDPQNIINLREIIIDLNKNHGVTFFITTHILNEVEKLATNVGIIRQGTIIDFFKFQQFSQLCDLTQCLDKKLSTLEDYYLFKCNQYDKTTENRVY
jgi:lantibiotic transport system ATP-binding protein